MKILFLSIFLTSTYSLIAQKSLIEHATASNWPIIRSEKISNNGKYVSYTLTESKQPRVVLQGINNEYHREFPGVADEISFTEDSGWLLFRKGTDSIAVFDLIKDSLLYIRTTGTFKFSGKNNKQWLAYVNGKQELIILNLLTGEQKEYSKVSEYDFSPNGEVLILNLKVSLNGTPMRDIVWLNLMNGKDTIIDEGEEFSSWVFDSTGAKLSYLSTKGPSDRLITDLRYYQSGMDHAKVLVDSSTYGMGGKVIRNSDISFSTGGDKVFFYLETRNKKDKGQLGDNGIKVLNSQDDSLRFEQMNGPFLTVVDFGNSRNIRQLGQDKDQGYLLSTGDNANHVLFSSNMIGRSGDYYWDKSARPDVYLVSSRDGFRKLIKRRLVSNELAFSPGGKYVVWFDRERKQWFAYDVANEILRSITKKALTPFYIEDDHPDFSQAAGIAGWRANDKTILIYDRFDIWEIDPSNRTPPVNITRGYGIKNNTGLRCLSFDENDSRTFNAEDTLIVAAFNFTTKKNGFFKLALSGKGTLIPLVMDARMYYFPGISTSLSGATNTFVPLKAKDADVYIFQRMSTVEYPNLVVTSDFKKFTNLTQLEPQKMYNWYKTELIHWKLEDGRNAEGILYKPENFDSKKKYPIIFHYYEKNSNSLNIFINPELSNGVMNIPWFTSNGYLVIVPNIYYKLGNPGKGVNNSVVSAARYMSHKPWVDSHHMGLQGHSFGGWETNYIVSRTSLFAAAAPSSAASDLVSFYGEYLPGGGYYETGQGRMGFTIWQNPKLYAESSPFLKADRVSTPLLILQNKGDYVVPYPQGRNWFNALKRLGKKAWMLSYEGEGHTIEQGKYQLDYSIRLGQFFDYFLKGSHPPEWMTKSNDPNVKGVSFIDR